MESPHVNSITNTKSNTTSNVVDNERKQQQQQKQQQKKQQQKQQQQQENIHKVPDRATEVQAFSFNQEDISAYSMSLAAQLTTRQSHKDRIPAPHMIAAVGQTAFRVTTYQVPAGPDNPSASYRPSTDGRTTLSKVPKSGNYRNPVQPPSPTSTGQSSGVANALMNKYSMLRKLKSSRLRSKSISSSNNDEETSRSNPGILKRLLMKRHKTKTAGMCPPEYDQSQPRHSTTNIPRNSSQSPTPAATYAPSISLLDGILTPNCEYYVTVSGGDRSKLLTFHPRLGEERKINSLETVFEPRPDVASEQDYSSCEELDGSMTPATRNEVLCAKISPSKLKEISKNQGFQMTTSVTTTHSRFLVSALSSQKDISNFSQVPDKNPLPGVTRFIYKPPPRGVSVDIGVNEDILKVFDYTEIYTQFMKAHTCYHIQPKSSKLVVVDSNIRVRKAFNALIENKVRAAPVWDSEKRQFVGMITITDVILMLKKFHFGKLLATDIEMQSIKTWRKMLEIESHPLIYSSPNDSLFEATRKLSQSGVHRLLVMDKKTGDAMGIITNKRLLRFLYLYLNELPTPSFLQMQVKKLKIGQFENVHKVKRSDGVLRLLEIFADQEVSAIPITDDDGKLFDVYSKFDAIFMAANRTWSKPDAVVNDALRERGFEIERKLHVFRATDTLMQIIEKLVDTGVHRLIGVDDDEKVVAIISISDVVRFMVLEASKQGKGTAVSNATAPVLQNKSDDGHHAFRMELEDTGGGGDDGPIDTG